MAWMHLVRDPRRALAVQRKGIPFVETLCLRIVGIREITAHLEAADCPECRLRVAKRMKPASSAVSAVPVARGPIPKLKTRSVAPKPPPVPMPEQAPAAPRVLPPALLPASTSSRGEATNLHDPGEENVPPSRKKPDADVLTPLRAMLMSLVEEEDLIPRAHVLFWVGPISDNPPKEVLLPDGRDPRFLLEPRDRIFMEALCNFLMITNVPGLGARLWSMIDRLARTSVHVEKIDEDIDENGEGEVEEDDAEAGEAGEGIAGDKSGGIPTPEGISSGPAETE
jgi:hypothetical protein